MKELRRMEHEQILTYVSPFIFFLWISLLVLTVISLWHQSSIADKIKIIKECSEEDKFHHLDYAIIRLLETSWKPRCRT